jgi:Putative lipoprotein GNA1162-like
LNTCRLATALSGVLVAVVLTGCAVKPYDYTNFRLHPPRSILVLPPLNESTAVEATWGYLSTVTQPLAERGFYVFPVAVIDQFLKENGLPTATGPFSELRQSRLTLSLGRLPRALALRAMSSRHRHGVGVNSQRRKPARHRRPRRHTRDPRPASPAAQRGRGCPSR